MIDNSYYGIVITFYNFLYSVINGELTNENTTSAVPFWHLVSYITIITEPP